MKLDTYEKIYKNAKRTTKHTGTIAASLSVESNAYVTIISKTTKCPSCNHTFRERICMLFNEPQRLSIFQAGLIYSLFYKNQIPADYASYHKTQAGERFIKNISAIYPNRED